MPKPAAKRRTINGTLFPSDVFQNFRSDTTKWEPNNALALAWASNLAYEQDNTIQQVSTMWGLTPQATIKGPLDIQGLVAGNDQFILIAFRGTISEKQGKIDANNWIVNLDAIQVAVGPAFQTSGRIHNGFARAFSTLWLGIQDALAAFPKKGQSLWITGHSLGGHWPLLQRRHAHFPMIASLSMAFILLVNPVWATLSSAATATRSLVLNTSAL